MLKRINKKGFSLVSGILLSLIIGLLSLFIADSIKIFSRRTEQGATKVNINVAIDAINKYHRCCNIIQNHSILYGVPIPTTMTQAFYSSHRDVALIGNNNYPINNLISPFTARGYVAAGETRGIVVELRHNNPKEYFQRDLSSFTDIANINGISSIICPMGLNYNVGSATCLREAGSSVSSTTSSTSSSTSSSPTTASSTSTVSSSSASSSPSSSGIPMTSSSSSSSASSTGCGSYIDTSACPIECPSSCTRTADCAIRDDFTCSCHATTIGCMSASSSSSASSTAATDSCGGCLMGETCNCSSGGSSMTLCTCALASVLDDSSSSSSSPASTSSTSVGWPSSSSSSAGTTTSSTGDPCGGSCSMWEVCSCFMGMSGAPICSCM